MRRITNIILHCTASPWGDAALIDLWHRRDRGWREIGYHFVILNGRRRPRDGYNAAADGQIESGRTLDDDLYLEGNEVGAHALGFNPESIGVCLVGKNGLYTFTQCHQAVRFIQGLCHKYQIRHSAVLGHYEIASGRKQGKTCPNIPMGLFRKAVVGGVW